MMTLNSMNPFSRTVAVAGALLALFLLAGTSDATINSSLQMQLGNPTSATVNPTNRSNYLVTRTVEALDFCDLLGVPRWASWDLTGSDIGSATRSSYFYTDTSLPSAFYRVKTADYTNSGYDRGHLCPSQDRTDTTANNKLVFFMSNIMPQTSENNQGPWARFEDYCQALAQTGNELLILCGPSAFTGSRIQPSGKVAIPGVTWKIVVVVPAGSGSAASRITTATRVISVKMPNVAGIRTTPWTNYITSAKQIQADTAYKFFSALSASIAEVLLAKVDGAATPVIRSFTPISGPVGTTVTINGSGLTGASSVKFNGKAAAFSVASAAKITATVPSGATSGSISIIAPGGLVTSSAKFTVSTTTTPSLPSISSFSPASGAVGTTVTITGANFTGATSVKFNGTAAAFTVVSATKITATVPSGATTGTIKVTTAAGTATSSGSFTVSSSGTGKVVISQVYGGGGNSGATYKNDFIELYNSGTATVDLSAYAIQYASASSATWSTTTLSGSLAPGKYYLIKEAAGSGGTKSLPTSQATGSINLAATSGKVALTKTQTRLTVSNPVGSANVVDFVGYGSANAYEGSGPAPTLSNIKSALRSGNGATDTNNNAADFSAGTVNPRN